MRIESPKEPGGVKKKNSTGRSAGAGKRFVVGPMGTSSGLSGASSSASISHIGALLASQEVDQNQNQREGAVKYGESVLAQLDQVKLGVLNGRLSPQALNHLRHTLAEGQRFSVDDRLQGILQQIELRAEVELAKLGNRQVRTS